MAGKHEEATTFRADNVVAIKIYKSLQAIKGAIANVNKRVRAVEVSNMDADKSVKRFAGSTSSRINSPSGWLRRTKGVAF